MITSTHFQQRNQQLIGALLTSPNTPIQTLASIIFEQATGRELVRETDPENGEEYFYKSGEKIGMVSLRVHPDVAEFFNWHSTLLSPRDGDAQKDSLFSLQKKNHETNTHIAKTLRTCFARYQRDTNTASALTEREQLAAALRALTDDSFSPSALPVILDACVAAKLAFNDPMTEMLEDDDREICGRVDDKHWFDVTQHHAKGWSAMVQVSGECKTVTDYVPSKYHAFLLGLISLLTETTM